MYGNGIFPYIYYQKSTTNLGTYTSPMVWYGSQLWFSLHPAMIRFQSKFRQAVEKVIDAHAKHMIDNKWVEARKRGPPTWRIIPGRT